jgi:hypothetical protein
LQIAENRLPSIPAVTEKGSIPPFLRKNRRGTIDEAGTADDSFLKEPAVDPVSLASLPRFASLTDATMGLPQKRSHLARFFLAPFVDVDERVARLAAASQAERTLREAAMSGGAE